MRGEIPTLGYGRPVAVDGRVSIPTRRRERRSGDPTALFSCSRPRARILPSFSGSPGYGLATMTWNIPNP